MLSEIFVYLTLITGITLAAVDDCPQLQFWNGTVCVSCKPCPRGFGVKTKCSQKLDTECEACLPGFDYSDTIGFERCFGCDEFSNCPLGNSKEIKKCNITSPRVCDGCQEGSYFNPGTGGCQKCSSPCLLNQDETKPCTTKHDRTCSPKTTVSTTLANSSTLKEVPKSITSTSADTYSVPSVKPGNQTDGDSPSPQESDETHWLWIIVGVVAIAIMTLIIFLYKRKKRNEKGRRKRGADMRRDNETRDTQEMIPLTRGLDRPIKDLTIDGKTFIAQRLNGKGSYGYYYWQRTGEKLGFITECKGWETAENPTERLLKAYGEKEGSTIGNLIKALRDPQVGLTQFANDIEVKFSSSTTQDQKEGECIEEIV